MTEQNELQTLEQAHEDRMNSSQSSFEKRFGKNEELARETYTDQGLKLGRELINQKKQFLKAADKYSDKSSDPFYQIRDNKTKFYETSGAYVLKARVPEHEKDGVQVRVKADKVTLSGSRSFNDEIIDEDHRVKTNNVQTFHESYDIPKKIKESEILKNYENGELTVVIPKVT
jgi:HSP20 family molecular chaperone IbpA